jgi:hypothetical protein
MLSLRWNQNQNRRHAKVSRQARPGDDRVYGQ